MAAVSRPLARTVTLVLLAALLVPVLLWFTSDRTGDARSADLDPKVVPEDSSEGGGVVRDTTPSAAAWSVPNEPQLVDAAPTPAGREHLPKVWGKVVNPLTGNGVGDCRLSFRRGSHMRILARTASDGSFAFDPPAAGVERIEVSVRKSYHFSDTEFRLQPAQRAGAESVVVNLPAGVQGPFRGQLRRRSESPIAGKVIEVRVPGTERWLAATTDAQGFFSFEEDLPFGILLLQPGNHDSFRLSKRNHHHRFSSSEPVSVYARTGPSYVVVIRPAPPIDISNLIVSLHDGAASPLNKNTRRGRHDGSLPLTVEFPRKRSGGTAWLSVRSPDGAWIGGAEVPIGSKVERERVVVSLERPGRLEGTFDLPLDGPGGMAQIELSRCLDRQTRRFRTLQSTGWSSPGEPWAMESIAPGEYVLSYSLHRSSDANRDSFEDFVYHAVAVRIESGRTTTVVLESDPTEGVMNDELRGTVFCPLLHALDMKKRYYQEAMNTVPPSWPGSLPRERNIEVQIERRGYPADDLEAWFENRTRGKKRTLYPGDQDEPGTRSFRFTGLPPGEYVMRIHHAGWVKAHAHEIIVRPSGSPLEIRCPQHDAAKDLHITAIDPETGKEAAFRARWKGPNRMTKEARGGADHGPAIVHFATPELVSHIRVYAEPPGTGKGRLREENLEDQGDHFAITARLNPPTRPR